jgi:O-antigen/teichoic acid export membrane protein
VSDPAAVVRDRPPGGTDGSGLSSRAVLVSLAMGLVGLLSYAGSLVLIHLLDAPGYRQYAAALMLVTVVGTFAAAMIPLPVAHVIRTHAPGSEGRRRGMAFAVAIGAVLGIASAVVTALVTSAFAPPSVVVVVALSSVALFVPSPAFGWMQGELRFVRLSVAMVIEVAIRVVVGVLAVLAGLGAPGALGGFVVGALAVLCLAPRRLGRDLAWRPGVIRERHRWSEMGGVAITQMAAAALVGADVVVVALVHADAVPTAGFQALSTLAKGPAYLATGAALVAFPLLRSVDARTGSILRAALRSFAVIAVPAAAVVATVPHRVALLVIPDRYAGSLWLLPVLAAAGLAYATLTVFSILMVALRAFRRCGLGMLVGFVVLPAGMAMGWRLGGVSGFAVGVAGGALLSAAGLWTAAAPLLPRGTLRRAALALGCGGLLAAALALAATIPVLWCAAVAVLALGVLRLSRRAQPGEA